VVLRHAVLVEGLTLQLVDADVVEVHDETCQILGGDADLGAAAKIVLPSRQPSNSSTAKSSLITSVTAGPPEFQ
jgi:hypothetical protein